MMNGRLESIRKRLKMKRKLPYLVFDLVNTGYLTGFRGSSAFLLLGESKTFFISDSRYEEYARSVLPPTVEFVLQKGELSVVL